jgi:acetate kinase
MNILLLNGGSSSLKGTLMESASATTIASGLVDWAGSPTRYRYRGPGGAETAEEVPWQGHTQAVQRFVYDLTHTEPIAVRHRGDLAAVGHRVVHGGEFTSSVRTTPELRWRIAALADLAPLHNPPGLEALNAAECELPDVPHVAVFDTAFHATLPPAAYTYPLPENWERDWGIRRFGFHGLSHAYCSRRAAEMLARPPAHLRLVICHLGHGCSASAVHRGQCVDTTMGFTPLDGLMMATRSGSIDPGIVTYVQQHRGLSAQQVEAALNRESGLLGVSGVSADMRQVLAAASEGHQRARLAVDLYTYRVRQAIGALTVTMGGIDALVFTAGVGEHAAEVRKAVCGGLECLGLDLDVQANASCRPDADIASHASHGRILVIATREDLTMLREVIEVLTRDG